MPVDSEFQIVSSPFKGHLALDEFEVTPPRCLILDGSCLKYSPLLMIDRVNGVHPDTMVVMYLRSIRAAEYHSLLSLNVSGLIDTSYSGKDFFGVT